MSQIIQAAIPDADQSLCDYILWERTPFPCGAIDAKYLYKAASRFKRANAKHVQLCELCDRIATPGKWTCSHCREMITKMGKQ